MNERPRTKMRRSNCIHLKLYEFTINAFFSHLFYYKLEKLIIFQVYMCTTGKIEDMCFPYA